MAQEVTGFTGFRTKVSVDEAARVLSEITLEREGVAQKVWRQVLDTQEAKIREALVSLGWTPPSP